VVTYLEDLEQLLFFEQGVFEIDRDFLLLFLLLLLSGLEIGAERAVVFDFVAIEAIQVVEGVHHGAAVGICELAAHEHLRVFPVLRPQLYLPMVHGL